MYRVYVYFTIVLVYVCTSVATILAINQSINQCFTTSKDYVSYGKVMIEKTG